MTCAPAKDAQNNSLHILSAYGKRDERPWQWSNGLWCRPNNTRWGTKPTAMSTLGWRYVEPAQGDVGSAELSRSDP